MPTALKQDCMAEPALRYSANSAKPLHSNSSMELFPITGIPETKMSANISNTVAVQLPLFDKLFYTKCAKRRISWLPLQLAISSNTTKKSLLFSRGYHKTYKESTIKAYVICGQQKYFLYVYGTLAYKNKSQENWYYSAQRDLHVLRNILCECKKKEDEYKLKTYYRYQ